LWNTNNNPFSEESMDFLPQIDLRLCFVFFIGLPGKSSNHKENYPNSSPMVAQLFHWVNICKGNDQYDQADS